MTCMHHLALSSEQVLGRKSKNFYGSILKHSGSNRVSVKIKNSDDPVNGY